MSNLRTVHHFVVKLGEASVRVPVNKEENRIASMVAAAQVREMIQAQVKKWKDGETPLTPKELKDLSDALAVLAKSSAEIYSQGQDEDAHDHPSEPVKVEPAADLSKIIEVKAELAK